MPKGSLYVAGRVRFSLCTHIFLFSQMLCLSSSVQITNSYARNDLLCLDLLLIDFYSCYVAICFFLGISLVPTFAIWDFLASALRSLFPEPMAPLAPSGPGSRTWSVLILFLHRKLLLSQQIPLATAGSGLLSHQAVPKIKHTFLQMHYLRQYVE